MKDISCLWNGLPPKRQLLFANDCCHSSLLFVVQVRVHVVRFLAMEVCDAVDTHFLSWWMLEVGEQHVSSWSAASHWKSQSFANNKPQTLAARDGENHSGIWHFVRFSDRPKHHPLNDSPRKNDAVLFFVTLIESKLSRNQLDWRQCTSVLKNSKSRFLEFSQNSHFWIAWRILVLGISLWDMFLCGHQTFIWCRSHLRNLILKIKVRKMRTQKMYGKKRRKKWNSVWWPRT